VLYNLSLGSSWAGLVLVIALASIGFGAVGTLFAAVGAGVRARDALLAVFIFPLLVPLIIAAAHVSTVLFDGGGLGGAGLWTWFLVVYDVVFLSVSFMTFDFVVEE
jgi:ABC-type transport system involved in cytochrome c biogenesis permease component